MSYSRSGLPSTVRILIWSPLHLCHYASAPDDNLTRDKTTRRTTPIQAFLHAIPTLALSRGRSAPPRTPKMSASIAYPLPPASMDALP